MSKKLEAPQSRRHIWVFDEDWEFLERYFGKASENRTGVGPTIRRIIQIYVGNLRALEQKRIDARTAQQKESV